MDKHQYLSDEASPSSPARDARFALVAVALLLALLAWGHKADSAAADQAFLQGQHSGVLLGRIEMADTVADAYALGRRDALAAATAGARKSSSLVACAMVQP